MNRERWSKINEIFNEACERPRKDQKAYIRDICGSDFELINEVFELLEADQAGNTLLDSAHHNLITVVEKIEEPVPSKIGRYTILKELGRGGMGIVYEATDPGLDRKVALKLLPLHAGYDEKAKKRFKDEAKAASRHDHPNIVTIYEIDETEDGRLFIAMAWYEGETLGERLKKGTVKRAAAADWFLQLAKALAAAHRAGIIHCDIKPANLFITVDNQLKVLDFGISRLMHSESELPASAGTIAYMSPEQLRGEPIGPESDIWAAGITMFEVFTGKKPYRAESRDELLEKIAGSERITELRSEKLGKVIETCINPDSSERYQNGEALVKAIGEVRSAGERKKEKSALAIILVLVASLLTIFYLMRNPEASVTNPGPGPSVAVMPFLNLSGSPDLDYLSEGITEELIHALSLERDLFVPARTSVYMFETQAADIAAIRSQLRVNYLLEGSLFVVDDTIRIKVRLVNTSTGFSEWSESYQYNPSEIVEIQRSITLSVLNQLMETETSYSDLHYGSRERVNPDAYANYLRGRYHWNKRTGDGFIRSIEFYERAIEADPGFARAHAGLAKTLALSVWYRGTLPDESYPIARAAADTALQLDQNLSEAHATMGSIYWQYERDLSKAEDAFRRAIQLNPKDVSAHNWLGELLVYTGRFDEGITHLTYAMETDPLSLVTIVDTGTAYYVTGDYGKALEYYRNALYTEPQFALARIFMGMAYDAMGEPELAIEQLETAIETGGPNPLWLTLLARSYAGSGNHDKARMLLSEIYSAGESRFISPLSLSMVYMMLGDYEKTFRLIEQSIEVNDPFLVYIDIHPAFNPLRDDPQFQSLAATVWK